MNAPRVSRREKSLQLSYDTPHRIHSSAIYPLTAPNGSEIVVYAHDGGLRILWRGGKRRKGQEAPSRANGNHADVIVLDDSDDEGQPQNQAAEDEHQYEDADKDQDEDASYPDFFQDINVEHKSKVLHIAVPSITPAVVHQLPDIVRSHIIVAYASIDGTVGVVLAPIHPPSEAEKQTESVQLHNHVVAHTKPMPRDVAIRISQNRTDDRLPLLLAACGTELKVWELSMSDDAGLQSKTCLDHPNPTKIVAFPSSRVQDQLLVSDHTGNVRLYDFSRPDSEEDDRHTSSGSDSNTSRSGRWMMSFHTPFLESSGSPAMASRKSILGASWILSGRGVLMLLEDGEWGVWMLDPSQTANKNIQDFALRGFLGDSATEPMPDTRNQKKLGSKLAPMTPNTRKAKSEKLFQRPQKAPGAAPSGGIKVTAVSNKSSGVADESVVMWYNNNIYSIPSMQTFWQRSSANSNNNTGNLGSLYTPGLTHITDINLMNEQITSISHFNTLEASGAQWERMNMRRNLLVSAEHRFIILHHLVPRGVQRRAIYEANLAELASVQDQRMLDAGELDIGGMDRMLTSMAGTTGQNDRARHVGFAR